MLYGVRVRNTEPSDHGGWATYVKEARASARDGRGMSQSELARRVGVDRVTVWRWESGVQRPEQSAIVQLVATALDLDLDEALAAAGMRPGVEAPATPTREPDEEVDLILTSKVSEAMKKRILDRLYDRREEDRQRRMEELRFILDQAG